ncbi:MAG TPA: alpha-1,3-galactosidase B [Bacteroidales bacterium]|nr:alpha-1,3-galactosidase B [Bacteroidales bacterium]
MKLRHRIPLLYLSSFLFLLSFSYRLYSFALVSPDTLNITTFGLHPDSRINAVPYVQKALDACRDKPGSVIFFPKGRYDFWPHQCLEKVYYESNTTDNNPRRCAILIEGLSGITVDCGESDFIFHDRMQPFTVDKSSDILIKGVSVDWDIPLTSEAEVIAVAPDYIDIRIDKVESPYVIEKGKLVFVGEGWKSEWWGTMEFTRENRTVAYTTGDRGCLGNGWRNYSAEEMKPGLVRLNYAFKRLPERGNYLVLRHNERDHSGMFIVDSRNVMVEDFNMFHNAGLGILAQFSENLTFRKVNSVPNSRKDRILAGHDDGFHFSNCKGQITLDMCRFHGLMDDPVNVHGTSVRIMEKKGDRVLVCKFMHNQSIGMIWARAGERVGLIENKSMATLATGIVMTSTVKDLETFEVEFMEPIPEGIEAGDALENLTWTPDVTITGSAFESNRARGILISTPGKVVIANNLFSSSGSAILIAGDANYWYESGGVKDVLIRDNIFTDECLTSMYQFCEGVISVYPEIPEPDPSKPCFHRNIRVENNQFNLFDYPVLYARSVDNLSFTGNTLTHSTRYEPWHPRKVSVSLEACKNVIINNNQIDSNVLGKNLRMEKMKKSDLKMGKAQFLIDD